MITVVFKKHVEAKPLKNQEKEESKISADENKNVTHTASGFNLLGFYIDHKSIVIESFVYCYKQILFDQRSMTFYHRITNG